MTDDRREPDLESSIWIGRSPEDIWDYLVDVSNDTQWRKDVTDAKWVSNPPHGVGSTGLHVVEGNGNWPWKITEWEEPHVMSWEVTGGRMEGGHAGYRVAPEDSGSRLTIHARVKPSAVMRILMLFMKRRMRRELAADLEKLKAILEA